MNAAAGASNVQVPPKIQCKTNNLKQPVDLEELVANTEEKRNWRGIIIALLVIITVLALIVTAIILVTPRGNDEEDGVKVSFKGLMYNEYKPVEFRPIWITGEERFLYRYQYGPVYEFDCKTNDSTEIMEDSPFRVLVTEKFTMSPDRKYALLKYDEHQVFRHSTVAKYKIYNLETRDMMDVPAPHSPYEIEFQYVNWAPKGHSLVLVQYNDIYYLKNINTNNNNNNNNLNRYLQLTFDGTENIDTIFNGVPDWVYEEEILESDNALWFSPDGKYLLYAVFNDTFVSPYDMPIYGELTENYVMHHPIRYPKAGTENPLVHLRVVNLQTNTTREIQPPREFMNRDHYFTTVSWQSKNTVLITWLNRAQNMSLITICTADTGKCVLNLRIDADGGWIDMTRSAIFTPTGHNYFLLLPHKDGAAGGFQHIAMIDATEDIGTRSGDGSKIFLTAGMWDVKSIVGYDDGLKTIYFTGTKPGDPTVRHLYSTTTLKDSPDFRQITCLTCDLGDGCQFVEASFTYSGKYYVLGCLGPSVPAYYVYSIEEGYMRTIEGNDELLEKMENLMMPREEYYKIPIKDDVNEYMWAKVLLPPVLKKDEIITYNLLFRVYGAPGTQMVTKEFKLDWEHYLSSTHSIIIAYVDGRGSGGRGNKWLHANYKRLGTDEVQDTITAARFFNRLSYVNTRTAIWGISYGGFLTTAVIARGTEAFKCGLAVSPVTDWRYYDSVYTERYMGFPSANDNLGAYNIANLSRYAPKFKSSRYMLIHGTGDDNVHFQNSAQLVKALTEADVYFRMQIYTDENHSLNWGNTKIHLYNTMEDFVLQCFGRPTTFDGLNGEVKETEQEQEGAK